MMKNFLLTATFSITILTLFLAPSATNLAFANGECEFQCGVEERIIFQECLLNTESPQFPFGDTDFCDGLGDDFFFVCVAQCPPPPECFSGFDCGDSFCSPFACMNFECVPLASPPDGSECGPIDACESNVCRNLECVQDLTPCDDLDECTINSCDPDLGCQTAPNPDPVCAVVGGVIVPLENTSLLVAGAQTFSWMIPVILSVLGIGMFVVSRKSENS